MCSRHCSWCSPPAARPTGLSQTTLISNTRGSGSPAFGACTRNHGRERRPSKVLMIIEENHSYTQMRAQMPYLSSLATKYAYATRYSAITHPSLPNYLALAGGSIFGVRDDNPSASHQITQRSVFDQAIHAGKTAKTYAESMPGHVRSHVDRQLRRQAQPLGVLRQLAGTVPQQRRTSWFIGVRGSAQRHREQHLAQRRHGHPESLPRRT